MTGYSGVIVTGVLRGLGLGKWHGQWKVVWGRRYGMWWKVAHVWEKERKANQSGRAVSFLGETESGFCDLLKNWTTLLIYVMMEFQFDSFHRDAVQISGFLWLEFWFLEIWFCDPDWCCVHWLWIFQAVQNVFDGDVLCGLTWVVEK